MEKTKYVAQKEVMSEDGDKIYLCYFITESENENASKRYGVGIDMYTQLAHQRTEKESKSAGGIFKTKGEAQLFINILSEGSVTPTTLLDIVEDNIATFTA